MVRLKTHTKADWQKIVKKHSGKTPRHKFEDLDSDSEYDSKLVIRGYRGQTGGGSDEITTTGFLENETGTVVAGVDSIPKTQADK